MLAKITLYDGTVYKIASQTVDTEDGIYLGRIKDELSLVSAMQEAGNAPATINLTIINYDDFIPHSKDLWAAEVLLTDDNGVSWRGKINFCNFDADGNLYVTASEKTAPELELQLPDEVRQVYTVDEDFHQSSVTMTIPLVIGGTSSNPILLSTILIDKTEGVYLICVGEIRSVVKVYNGTEELPNTAYTSYTGTSSQTEHAGFAYVQIAEDYRLNSDGSYAEINVDVVGLKLGNHTEAECRNGALFLYYFLTTADTGVNGWGCGIDSSLIDSDSFQSAITLCNQLGYKLDGIMWLRQSAQSWIDQICQAIHGKYSINANGKRSLFIDYAGNASKKTFTASNMQVERYGKNSYTSVVYNKGVLSYDYNPITGLFMQSAQYENSDSIAQIGEQKFIGESYLIKDATTALAILEYTCKRSQIAAEAIEFKTDDVETNLRAGDIITINRPDLNLNNALYQIQSISTTDFISNIIAVKFDTSVFSVTGTASSVNWGNERDITPALTPAQATNLLLSTGFDINPDGTGIPYISGTFTVPDGGWLAAAVQYGIGTNPSNWTELALITEGKFKLSPVNVGTVYSIRVRMITPTGHSDYITGQITATGDSTPPLAPTITAKATDKTVTVQCGLDNPPYDMGGFQIYRKKSTESVYTYIGSVAANRGYASITDYVDEYVTYNYQAKSYDRSGNLSTNFSNVASVTVTGITANDVAATALAMPTGSILRLSAKNCTTASIAEDKGVKDCSGMGNHGKAGTNVSVIKDNEKGDVFDFGASNTGLTFPDVSIPINTTNGMTYVFNINSSSFNVTSSYPQVIRHYSSTSGVGGIIIQSLSSIIRVEHYSGSSRLWYYEIGKSFALNKWHHFAITISPTDGTSIYYNGELIGSNADKKLTQAGTPPLTINTNGSGRVCKLFDIRIYPRALSASEIKTIYMFPDDVTFGQLTADLIGANVIKAQNLVMTENIISNAAQINNAVFQSLIVTNGSTVANQVDVGGRNLLKNSNNGGNGWNNTGYPTCSIYLGNNKPKAGDTVTFSIEVADLDLTKINRIGFYNSGGTVTILNITNANLVENGICKVTGSWVIANSSTTAANTYVNIYAILYSGQTRPSVNIKWVKLEYGNKATTWTPAPEDVDADISTAQDTADAVDTKAQGIINDLVNGTTNYVAKIQGSMIVNGTLAIGKLESATQTKINNGDTANGKVSYQYGTCSTAAATAAKVVTLENYPSLFTGSRISVKFSNANSVANPTLNVNSKGAKTIRAKGANLTASSIYNWVANDVVDFVYDGTYWNITSVSGTDLANTANSTANEAAATLAAWCYNNDTTFIDGANIYTGTVTAGKLAANSITADKISVANGTPRSCLFSLNFKSVQTYTAGTIVPDLSGSNNPFVIRGTWEQIYRGAAYAEYILLDNTAAGREHYIANQKAITVPASGWTFLICAYAHPKGSGEHILFDARPSGGANNNRIQFRIAPDTNSVRILSYNSSSVQESVYGSLTSCRRSSYKTIIVQCTSATSITVYCVDQRRGDTLENASNKVTITLTNARSALTAAIGYLQIGGLSGQTALCLCGNMGDIQFYNRALSLDELKYIVQNVGNYDSGLITADRIAAGCVETRHLTADAIVGKTFQTASNTGTNNAAGVRFNSSGIQGFNGSAKKFDLSTNGKLTCSDVDLTGKITATSGSFTGAVTATSGSFGDCQINTTDTASHYCSMYLNSSRNIPLSINNTGGGHAIWIKSNARGIYIEGNAGGVGETLYVENKSSDGSAAILKSGGGDCLILKGTTSSYYGLYVTSGKTYCASGTWTGCDESTKKDIKDVSTLDKLKSIRVKKFKYSQKAIEEKEWRKKQALKLEENLKKGIKTEEEKMPEFKDDENAPDYIMAMAGEFNKAFGVDNGNEEEINYTNAIGVALRAIQELAEIVDSQTKEISDLKARLSDSEITDTEPIKDDEKEQKNSINTSEIDDLKV